MTAANKRGIIVCLGLWALSSAVSAQRPRSEFAEYLGTWTLDESAGDIRELRAPRILVIAATPTEITVTKDSGAPEVYRIDGTESTTRELRAGVPMEHRYSLLWVTGVAELTSKSRRDNGKPTQTHIVTDAYGVSGDALTVGRQRDLVTVEQPRIEAPRNLTAFTAPAKYIQTLIYRRR
jgi:hypothetical protein